MFGRGNYRGAGVSGHHSFEVYLSGGAYGSGRWALLDHDVSTVIFTEDGKRLMSLGARYRESVAEAYEAAELKIEAKLPRVTIFPKSHYVTPEERLLARLPVPVKDWALVRGKMTVL